MSPAGPPARLGLSCAEDPHNAGTAMADEEIRAQINRLYWESDESVASIADRVGVSRRALYDAIDPRPANRTCPECGAPLGFRNRTAEEERNAECAACGHETVLPEETEAASDVGQAGPASPEDASRQVGEDPYAAAVGAAGGPDFDDPEVEQERDAARMAPVRPIAPRSGASLGAVMLAGLTAGAVAGWLIRRN